METWKEVRDYIVENYDGTYDRENDTLRALLDQIDGRSQFVEIKRQSTWIEVSSCVGYIEKADIFDFLEDLSDEFCGGAVRRGLDIYIRDCVQYEAIEENGIGTLFLRIARIADKYEKKYVGGDSN